VRIRALNLHRRDELTRGQWRLLGAKISSNLLATLAPSYSDQLKAKEPTQSRSAVARLGTDRGEGEADRQTPPLPSRTSAYSHAAPHYPLGANAAARLSHVYRTSIARPPRDRPRDRRRASEFAIAECLPLAAGHELAGPMPKTPLPTGGRKKAGALYTLSPVSPTIKNLSAKQSQPSEGLPRFHGAAGRGMRPACHVALAPTWRTSCPARLARATVRGKSRYDVVQGVRRTTDRTVIRWNCST